MHKALARTLRTFHRGEKGITGLETAIILIAFVTVASVLAYSVLSAGIFSAERGKETVYRGLDQAQSSMQVRGSVYATDNNSEYLCRELFCLIVRALIASLISTMIMPHPWAV